MEFPAVLRVFLISGMFRRSASLAIPHLKSFAAIPAVSRVQLGHTKSQRFSCHTNRSVELPSFRHFQDQFLTTSKEKWGKNNGPVFRNVCVFDVSRAVGISHDSNPCPNRSRKSHDTMPLSRQLLERFRNSKGS